MCQMQTNVFFLTVFFFFLQNANKCYNLDIVLEWNINGLCRRCVVIKVKCLYDE